MCRSTPDRVDQRRQEEDFRSAVSRSRSEHLSSGKVGGVDPRGEAARDSGNGSEHPGGEGQEDPADPKVLKVK